MVILVADLRGICHMIVLAADSGGIRDIDDVHTDFAEICHRPDFIADLSELCRKSYDPPDNTIPALPSYELTALHASCAHCPMTPSSYPCCAGVLSWLLAQFFAMCPGCLHL